MKTLYRLLFAILFVTSSSSCSKDESIDPSDPTKGLLKLAEDYAPGAGSKVALWAERDLQTGYNRLYVLLTDSSSNKRLNRASVSLLPLMKMSGTMTHSSPFENPESDAAESELFPCAAVFTMPGAWTLRVNVQNLEANKSGSVTFPLTVADSKEPRVIFASSESGETKYVITYINPHSPKTGLNNLEFLVNEQVDMMSFPPAADLQIGVTPEMPGMGHGSPNNVDPLHRGSGHYAGKVNFTMTGYWKLNLTLQDAEGPVNSATPFFNVTF